MLYNIEYWNTEKFLPTNRHKNFRARVVQSVLKVNIAEPSEAEFPIAFIVHDYQSVYEGAKDYRDFNEINEYKNEFKMFPEEIRTYKNKLYTPVRVTYGAAISTLFESLSYINNELEIRKPYGYNDSLFNEHSIVKETDRKEVQQSIRMKAKNYIIYDNKVWKQCGEPMYNITTFGLGHNHGGTGFFITHHYNPNIRKENYFNALERDKAITYGKQTALNRGDTKSIDGMGDRDIIEVFMPEMVKRKPSKEHGNGCDFLNMLDTLTSTAGSSNEAGLLVMATALLV